MLDRNLENYTRRVEALDKEMKEMKVEIVELQRELPVFYVRKTDFQRCRDECNLNIASLGQKIDDFKTFFGDKLDELRKEVRYARTK